MCLLTQLQQLMRTSWQPKHRDVSEVQHVLLHLQLEVAAAMQHGYVQ
jgi:hypothetical protein